MGAIQFIQVTPGELQEAILEGVKSQLDILKKEFQPKEPEEYLSRQEVADLLKVDLSTLHNWAKKGLLTRYALGSRVYYKRSEIEESLINLE